MKTFEITTPALKTVTEALTGVISARQTGAMEKDEARDITNASKGVISAVGQELKVRLAMPKLAAMEAKMIEAGADQQQLAAA
jgi:hypothetical protein